MGFITLILWMGRIDVPMITIVTGHFLWRQFLKLGYAIGTQWGTRGSERSIERYYRLERYS